MSSMEEIRKEIMTILDYFKRSKAYFRYIGDKDIGKVKLPPYNILPNVKQYLEYDQPITIEFQEKQNSIGHFLNQNICIRLLALLESHQVIGNSEKINKNLKGWEDLEVLRRLRHRFAHSSGKYNSEKVKDRKLMEVLMSRYKPCSVEPSDFPINQDKVIYPIVKGVLQYTEAKFSHQ